MGRRFGPVRAGLDLAAAMVLATALAACGGSADPYAVLDQARTASYDRIQVSLGFDIEAPPPSIPDMPDLNIPGTSVHVDPGSIVAAADIPAESYYLRVAIPVEAFGQQLGLGMPFASMDLELLADGADVYVKSPLLPLALQGGIGGVPIKGDLAGWVRFSGAADLAPMAPALLGFGLFGGPGGLDLPDLPLPSPGEVSALRDLLTEMGATVEYAGTESVDGVELVHLKAGLRIATLAGSRPFLALTGMSRDQVQGLLDLEGKVGISSDIWVNKATGRLATLRIDGTNDEQPATTVAVTLQVAEPGPDITFQTPPTFTDVDLSELMGDGFPGFGLDAVGGGVSEPVSPILEGPGQPVQSVPTPAP